MDQAAFDRRVTEVLRKATRSFALCRADGYAVASVPYAGEDSVTVIAPEDLGFCTLVARDEHGNDLFRWERNGIYRGYGVTVYFELALTGAELIADHGIRNPNE